MRRLRRSTLLAAGLATVAMVGAACGGSSNKSTTPTTSSSGGSSGTSSAAIPSSVNSYNPSPSGSKTQGGTAYWAQAPSAAPDYIFPMVSAQTCGTNNIEYLAALLYRPLYWYGNGNKATIDYDYSIGQPPAYSNNNQTVTVKLNNWKWSDGEQVTSRDVEFWVNLQKADPATNSCYYVPPAASGEKFFPDNVASMSTPDSSTIVFHLTQSYNPNWFTYNELSQITPLPLAWDRTALSQPAPTSDTGNLPDTTQAEAVYKFLDAQAKSTQTWVSSPIWSIVDGPFKLSNFTPTGEVDFVPNPSYSGSPKPTISKLVELPFTDNNAEVTALKTNGVNGLTVGYLPPEDSGQATTLQNAGYAPASAYTLSFSYFPLNLNNPKVGPVFQQAYFRQAFQHLIDQPGWTTAYLNGWAEPTAGPVPPQPPNSFADSTESHPPYGFDVNAAMQLLKSHGWNVVPNGQTTCANAGSGPSQCGAGVAAGTAISFNLDYASGLPATANQMQDLAAQAKKVGIQIQLTNHDFNTVISTATQCKPTDAKCAWTAENWSAGWVYAPDFYPTGESLFLTGAAANFENYSDPTADKLILATTTAPAAQSQSALNAYQDYIINQAPVVFFPTSFGNPIPGGPALIDSKLGGVQPNAYAYITPEQWYFTS